MSNDNRARDCYVDILVSVSIQQMVQRSKKAIQWCWEMKNLYSLPYELPYLTVLK